MSAVHRVRVFAAWMASLVLGCTRSATQVFVVAHAPEGAFDAIVIEARDAETSAPCLSRDAAASSAVSLRGPLREGTDGVSSLTIAPYDERPLRITVWGKRAGVDAARRTFLVVPRRHESRSLCVPLHVDERDCGCTDLSRARQVNADSRLEAESACAALGRAGSTPPEWRTRTACDGFSAATCEVAGARELNCARAVDASLDARGDQ